MSAPRSRAPRVPALAPLLPTFSPGELVVNLFAGGGGVSVGIEWALGRTVDYAVNHDDDALAQHRRNHPTTIHAREDVWLTAPEDLVRGRPVGLLWVSPDCRHFSQSANGAIKSARVRSLAWIVVRWVYRARVRAIGLENVPAFETWCPLRADGQPDLTRAGVTYRAFCAILSTGVDFATLDPDVRTEILELLPDVPVAAMERGFGYHLETRCLVARDHGAPTIRRRFFLLARNDGHPIQWPAPSHGPSADQPWRSFASCIDWSVPALSIAATPEEARAFQQQHGLPRAPKRPLAAKTIARTVEGLRRFVLQDPSPFLVRVSHASEGPNSRRWGHTSHAVTEPLPTVTRSNDFALVTPFFVGVGGPARAGEPRSASASAHTILTENNTALVTPFFVGTGGPAHAGKPRPGTRSAHTILTDDHTAVVAPILVTLRGTAKDGQRLDTAIRTITAGGEHHALAVPHFAAEPPVARRARLRALLGDVADATLTIAGEPAQLADVTLRMLVPRELYRAQGFPEDFTIDRGHDGRVLTRTAQVAMAGNAVPPHLAAAVVGALFRRDATMTQGALPLDDAAA